MPPTWMATHTTVEVAKAHVYIVPQILVCICYNCFLMSLGTTRRFLRDNRRLLHLNVNLE